MNKQNEPSAESLEEMPEIDDQRFRRLPERGHHANRSVGEIVTIDAELWAPRLRGGRQRRSSPSRR